MTIQITKLDIYINYPGHCEKAFKFYEQHLGGSIQLMLPHQHPPANFPNNWKRPILHAMLDLGGTIIRGADVPGAEPMRSTYLTLNFNTAEEAEEIYQLLSQEAEVFMKMEETPFANRFAMLRDQFGTSWMMLHQIPGT